jgi:pimeloyl-ACP methyl ester carboxylesterase
MSGPTSHTFFSQRLRLHYVDWGNPDAPPLLMVHGGRDHCRSWDWLAQLLTNQYHVIAPDLRGHGDSQWLVGGSYVLPDYVYDLAQLVRQTQVAPVSIIGHSLGGMISLQYAGLYPDSVRKIIAIEGLGMPPKKTETERKQPIDEHLTKWVEYLRKLSGRRPHRYKNIPDAIARMREANGRLTAEQAHHLTIHGVNQNEDGTFSWKFDNYVRVFPPYGLSATEQQELWARISCPALLLRGTESWDSNPLTDGRAKYFKNATTIDVNNAGHWVHHDKLDQLLNHLTDFLPD